ncbi:AMIN domain-containing protein [Argonema galeatum]|uniref:AMIN domain-containing protein n=1 Tax=Argonema galeatum TaxID=2942762 RepID=UPI002011A5F6|nr:AMIN domain-containing protein [Argonema galeatum]MCL1466666.1 AMIN domain-containing protein [Argonema galeatum A003/A1]
MRLFWGICQTSIAGAVIVLTAAPAHADLTLITNVRLAPTSNGLDIVLETQSGDMPQVFTINRGNTWIAEITNTKLKLPQANSFNQDNPAPGIASMTIIPLSENSVQVILTRQAGSLTGEVTRRDPSTLVLSLSLAGNNRVASPAPTIVVEAKRERAAAPEQSPIPNPQSPIPNPQSSIPNPQSPIPNPQSPAANSNLPFLPQAVAPPLGDIAVSNLDIAATSIDLGTSQRITRLVLRNASAREVLTLLVQAAGLSIVFAEDAAPTPSPNTPPITRGRLQTGAETLTEPNISMEVQNESIQNVFNYVLQLTRLQGNRVGNTILVGRNLPAATRGLVMRTIRLNQLKATMPESPLTTVLTSGSSLTSGGSQANSSTNTSSQVGRNSTTTRNIPFRGAIQALEALGANGGGSVTPQQNAPAPNPFQRSPDPTEQLLDGLQVTADSRTNSVTLIGPLKLVEIATNYLAQLDVRRRQVAVNVKIIEVNLTNQDTIGASFSFGVGGSFFNVNQGSANINFGRFNPRFINPNPSQNPGSLFSPNVIEGPNLARAFQFPRQFLLNLQSQITSNNAKILTDPTLIVQEGSHSQVNLTTQVFAGFRQITEAAPGNQTRTVSETKDPIDVGVILNIAVDQIDDNGFITLFVSPEVSSPGERITDPSRNDLLIQQLVNRRRLETGSIRLRDGQTLILTGIIQEQDRTITTKTPILGDIPIIGALFRSRTSDRTRNEIVVLVTPNIMDDSNISSSGSN